MLGCSGGCVGGDERRVPYSLPRCNVVQRVATQAQRAGTEIDMLKAQVAHAAIAAEQVGALSRQSQWTTQTQSLSVGRNTTSIRFGREQ
jgi:hypothetical protein